jgi:hypothetical protein
MEKMEQNHAQMEEKKMALDGKMSKVLLSTNNNAIALADLKTMIMDFMGKKCKPNC